MFITFFQHLVLFRLHVSQWGSIGTKSVMSLTVLNYRRRNIIEARL